MVDQSATLRCFISHSVEDSTLVRELKSTLKDLGVDAFDARDITPGQEIGSVTTSALRASDFVAVIMSGIGQRDNQLFELGFAAGLGKPLVLILNGDRLTEGFSSDIRYITMRSAQLKSSKSELKMFLKNIRKSSTSSPRSSLARPDVDHAKFLLNIQRNEKQHREAGMEKILADLFRQSNADVSIEEMLDEQRLDMLVWSDPLVSEFGGPLIIELKYYGGSSGSVIMNARHTLEKLNNYVENSSAALGVLVYDHDRPSNIQVGPGESARAIAISIDDMIDAFGEGKLADEFWRRRAHAASSGDVNADAG